MSIEEQITAALDSRAVQRPFVDDLTSNWDALANSFETLTSAAEDLARAAGAARAADTEHRAVFSETDRFLNSRADWQDRAAKLSDRLKECAGRVRVLQTRVTRKTVNIGVIGVTGAGKSTLLRKLSGLSLDHIPSNQHASSTATPSRIFHEPGADAGRADLYLHTWDSFLEEVLVPLHEKALLPQAAPSSIDAFQRFDYDGASAPEGQAGAERYLIRLRKAHDSLDSYRALLHGGMEKIGLDRLREFVAYPPEEDSRNRPYHAVRSVDIFCRFPEVGAVRLGLVDLPGSGEAGLDVHGRFLASLSNQTDLLFIVKRPSNLPGTEQDWEAKQLADEAGAGVRLQDFAYQLMNRDASVSADAYEAALARAIREGGGLAGEILQCDIAGTPPAGEMQSFGEFVAYGREHGLIRNDDVTAIMLEPQVLGVPEISGADAGSPAGGGEPVLIGGPRPRSDPLGTGTDSPRWDLLGTAPSAGWRAAILVGVLLFGLLIGILIGRATGRSSIPPAPEPTQTPTASSAVAVDSAARAFGNALVTFDGNLGAYESDLDAYVTPGLAQSLPQTLHLNATTFSQAASQGHVESLTLTNATRSTAKVNVIVYQTLTVTDTRPVSRYLLVRLELTRSVSNANGTGSWQVSDMTLLPSSDQLLAPPAQGKAKTVGRPAPGRTARARTQGVTSA